MQSYPSPAHAPRVEVIGPHFQKIFLPDRWNPIHVLMAPDTGPPHDHPYTMDEAHILVGGYDEDVWELLPGGGYRVWHGVQRRPGRTHRIAAEMIHLIRRLPLGFSLTEAVPQEASRPWYFYDFREDGSVYRHIGLDGPHEYYHPAGPVEVLFGVQP